RHREPEQPVLPERLRVEGAREHDRQRELEREVDRVRGAEGERAALEGGGGGVHREPASASSSRSYTLAAASRLWRRRNSARTRAEAASHAASSRMRRSTFRVASSRSPAMSYTGRPSGARERVSTKATVGMPRAQPCRKMLGNPSWLEVLSTRRAPSKRRSACSKGRNPR